jgi:hypothetical protein
MSKFLLILFVLLAQAGFAQPGNGSIEGRLVHAATGAGFEAQLLLPRMKQLFSTDTNGIFSVSDLPFGLYSIWVMIDGEPVDSFSVALDQKQVHLGDIAVRHVAAAVNAIQVDIPAIALERVYADDDVRIEGSVSILLQAAGVRDPFLNAATFVFGQYNFRPRGYGRQSQQVYINGILMNDPASGNVVWARWSGLNDVFKNQSLTYGSGLHQQAYGGLNGTLYFDAGASEQAPQSKVSYSLSNRTYNNRLMFTYSSGVRKSGWAYTFSGSRRSAEEGYVEGTFLDAVSGFASAGKTLNDQSQLTCTLMGAYSTRGRSGAATDEVYQLTNNQYYNPNWGWQEEKKRNARVSRLFQPIGIIQYQYQPGNRFYFTTSLGFQTGINSISSLDWYNATDPRSDYYRNLPAYYASDPNIAGQLREQISADPGKLQLNWPRFYNVNRANRETLHRLNGTEDSFRANRSLYVIGSDEEQLRRVSWGSNLQYKVSEKLTVSGGTQLAYQYTRYARRLTDLLGGDYFLNYNMFAIQQYPGNPNLKQNDLNYPDRAVKAGERYRYHYTGAVYKALLWGQSDLNFRKISCFSSVSGGYSAYQRNGIYRNALYPASSEGKSPVTSFVNYAAKTGFTYKANGRNYIILNGALSADEPAFDNVYVAPRLRNQVVAHSLLQQTLHVETGYLLRASRVNVRAILYATEIRNATTIRRFYNDEPEYQSFVNFVMTRVNTRHPGVELAIDYAVTKMISWNAAAAIGQSFYTNRPAVQIYNDNDTVLQAGSKEVFIKNYYLGVGPQSAYTTGVAYNGKKYWYLRMNANYIDRNYVAVNPARRSIEAAEFIQQSDPAFSKIFDQEKLPAFFTIDLSGGKSFRLNKLYKKMRYSTMLYLNFGLSNVLDKRDIKLIGFEQLRYDFTNNDPGKFPSKYIYGFGRTFFANLSIKF